MKELWRRLMHFGRRSRFDSELSDEMEFHLECRADELEAEGLPRERALALARREFGRPTRALEKAREAWSMRWLEDLSSDLRYAARALRRNPTFALTAIFCLALGIGANTTMFNITTSALFSEPSCRDARSLLGIREGGNNQAPFEDLKILQSAHVFYDVAGINVDRELNWRDGDRTRRIFAALVTGNYFGMVGVPFRVGRGIAPRETKTVVLSERIWRGRFASDAGILGRRLVLDGRDYTVVGILPKENRAIVGFGISPDAYIPVMHDDDALRFYARAPAGMTRAIARERARSVFAQIDRIRPKDGWKRADELRISGVTGPEAFGDDVAPIVAFFAMLMILVNLVLVIACTNVASLLLARASSRSQELALRVSLGASRGRIIRHLMAESLLLAFCGAGTGLMITVLCAHLASRITFPAELPIHLLVTPDWRLLIYSMLIGILSAMFSGLLPAFRAIRRDVNSELKTGDRETSRAWGLRSVLVAGQLAITVVLLAAGFVFLHSLMLAASMHPGFDVNHTIWAYMRLAPERYGDANQMKQKALVSEALERLRALPGVKAAAITQRVPLNDNCTDTTELWTDLDRKPKAVEYECNHVGSDYFQSLGIPMVAGREFSRADAHGSVAIVNETFARQLFGGLNPVGHTVYSHEEPPRLIVAVVKDSKYFMLSEKQRLALYEPYFVRPEPINLHFMVRAAGNPSGSVRSVTETLSRLDSTAAVETRTMSKSLDLALFPNRAGASMLGAMGVLGLVLAGIGLYGVVLYSVCRRTREIGLRLALGATPGRVLRMVCRDSAAFVAVGLGVGVAIALVAVRPLAMFLVPGVSTSDPKAFLSVVAVLAAVTAVATLGPALRASRLDPMRALRYE